MTFARKEAALAAGPLTYYEAGSGQPLLYLHGAAGLHRTGAFDPSPVLSALAERYRVVAPIHPGLDGTPLIAGVDTVRDIAAFYAGFARETLGERIDVMGYSWGGWVGLWLAVLEPKLVDLMVLEGPAGLRPDGKGGLPQDLAELPALLYAHPEKLPPQTGPLRYVAENFAAVTDHYGDPGLDQALAARLGEIEALTLVLMGSLERMIPVETGRLLKDRLRRCFLVYVHDAAHALEIDQPERVLKAVNKFFTRGQGYLVNWGDAA